MRSSWLIFGIVLCSTACVTASLGLFAYLMLADHPYSATAALIAGIVAAPRITPKDK